MSLGDDVLEPISLELGMTPMNEHMHACAHIITIMYLPILPLKGGVLKVNLPGVI